MAEYQYRIYEKKDDAGVFALLELMWGKDVAARSAKIWDWKINQNPYNPPEGPRSYVALDGEKIIAVMGAIPMRFKFQDRITTFLWVVDYLADPSYKTVGWRIFNRLYKEPYGLVGTPNQVSYTIGIAAKWFEICNFYNYFKIIRMEKMVAQKVSIPGVPFLAGLAWKTAMFGLSLFRRPLQDNTVVLQEVFDFGPDFDALWAAVSPGYEAIGVRSSQFLKWKYLAIPEKKFRIFMARKAGQPLGYIITHSGDEKGYKKGEIVDFLTAAEDVQTLTLLFQKAIGELTAAGADLISCFLIPYNQQHARVLSRFGFWFKKKRYPSIAYQTKTGDVTKAELQSAKWYINGGDSDLAMY